MKIYYLKWKEKKRDVICLKNVFFLIIKKTNKQRKIVDGFGWFAIVDV